MPSFEQLVESFARISPIATLISVGIATIALYIKIRQDAKDLRRRQAEVARLVYIDLHQDEYSKAALLMLDFEGWRHTTRDFKNVRIVNDDIKTALAEMRGPPRPDKELLVRRSFDTLFGKLENVMVLADPKIGLVQWTDFAELFGYNIHNMRDGESSKILSAYARQYGLQKIVNLIKHPDDYWIPPHFSDLNEASPSSGTLSA